MHLGRLASLKVILTLVIPPPIHVFKPEIQKCFGSLAAFFTFANCKALASIGIQTASGALVMGRISSIHIPELDCDSKERHDHW